MMASSNLYAKNYSNRRTNAEAESYKLILFPADNSIAVVKSKQCSPAEHDGFLHVQSGRKKFTGVVLEEGSLSQCSKAADQLTKKQVNPEIESDYERSTDENVSKQCTGSVSTISTLKMVPFGNATGNTQSTTNSSTCIKSNDRPDPADVVVDIVTSCQATGKTPINQSPAKLSSRSPPSTNKSIAIEKVGEANKRRSKHSIDQKNKRRKTSHREATSITTFDDIEEDVSSDDEEGAQVILCSTDTPSFIGRRVLSNPKQSNSHSNMLLSLQEILAFLSKIESQYLQKVVVAQERTEASLKCLLANQKKMQKALRKQKINISLVGLDEPAASDNDQTFLTSLEYTTNDGITTDLLKKSGVKEHANLYVTLLIDVLYKPEELLALETVDVPNDERYLLIKDAVKHKFRLGSDELETMWESWLHSVFLAKRRTLRGKKKQEIMQVHSSN